MSNSSSIISNNPNPSTGGIIPVRRMFMTFTTPLGRVTMQTEYEYEPIQNNSSTITPVNNTSSSNGSNTTTNNNNPRMSTPSLAEILPMFMLMNELSSVFLPAANNSNNNYMEYLRQHPSFAHLTPEQIQAFLNGGGNKAKPPASSEVVELLPRVRINADHAGEVCTVCQDEFECNTTAIRLPCAHLFHNDCILPWLKEHNSCCTCRYELLTDDEEYNRNVVLKQAPPKVIPTNNTSNNTTTEKDSDVVMSDSGNSEKSKNMPELIEIVEELKRQVSCSAKQADLNDNAMDVDSHENNNHNINNDNTSTSSTSTSSNADNSSNNFNSTRQLKRKHEAVYSHSGSAVVEDITDQDESN